VSVGDMESLLALHDFPVDHWQHLRTTNAVKSTFATVRHRTTRTRNCVSRSNFLGLAFKLIEEAGKTWRRINGAERITLLLEDIALRTANRCTAIKRLSRNSYLENRTLASRPRTTLDASSFSAQNGFR
jgi:hypothetical protein